MERRALYTAAGVGVVGAAAALYEAGDSVTHAQTPPGAFPIRAGFLLVTGSGAWISLAHISYFFQASATPGAEMLGVRADGQVHTIPGTVEQLLAVLEAAQGKK
jgi:hypothetical protein